MSTILTRAIQALDKIQFAEAQEVKNELQQLQLQAHHNTGITVLKAQILGAAIKSGSKAYKALEAMEALDEVDALMGLLGTLNKELAENDRQE